MVEKIARTLLGGDFELKELSQEASPRRYFRIGQHQQLMVLSEAPPAKLSQQLLTKCNIRTPQFGTAIDGAYLIEDIGDLHLAHQATLTNYSRLIQQWLQFAESELDPQHPNANIFLNSDLFQKELSQFVNSYLLDYRRLQLPETQQADINELCRRLAEDAAEGPQCLQHRDFHCRNILLSADNQLVWIDYQDLRRGPIFYDLASLFTDAYIDLDDDIYELLTSTAIKFGQRHGLSAAYSMAQFHLTALQRVLKALGTFGLLLKRGRSEYLSAEQRARIIAIA
ncbi:MAG: phosphotransferase, partial [Planctomycetota bacterium]|nr:phosphotransferase [Planctomycetota bacterium]